jgi:serine phosphatase RsbU (regulator of sigma subunit)
MNAMRLDLRGLWLHCTGIVIAILAAAILANGLLSTRTAAPLISAELNQTALTIGNAVGRPLELALSYGIPVDKLVGVNPWLAEIVAANPIVTSLSLHNAAGQRVFGVGPVMKLPADPNQLPAGARLIPLRAVDGAVVASLLVVCDSLQSLSGAWLASIAVAIALALAAAWWVLRGLRLRLREPVRVYDRAAEVLRAGSLPRLAIPLVRDPATALLAALAERVLHVRMRTEAVVQKIGEVRAAHFDPNVLQGLDELANALTVRLETAENAIATESAAARTRLAHRVIMVALLAIALVAGAMSLDQYLQRQSANQQLAAGGARTLDVAWQSVLDRDHALIGGVLNEVLGDPSVRGSLALGNAEELRAALSPLATINEVQLTVFENDGDLIATSARQEDVSLDAATRSPLAASNRVAGVWQNAARNYQVGVVQRLGSAVGDVLVVASRPLSSSLGHLSERLGVHATAVDLRGQPLADIGPEAQALAGEWRVHGRRSVRVDTPAGVIAALPFTGPGGHDLGTLVTRLPLPLGTDIAQAGVGVLVLIAAAVMALLALAYINHLFDPLLGAIARLERLARGHQAAVEPERKRESAEVDSLNRSAHRLGEKIDALETLKRSRERQGRRQARFIRHQMMQLAERLDEDARKAILDDLERIEHAGQPATDTESDDPLLERLVDEFGVLALGFQNLVGRVGAQYQELDRLVHELREALRAKTQFIALQQELEIARNMQSSILPRKFDAHPGLAIHATMIPAKEVGGDFYDFFALDEHRVALVMADVSGKGVPAAFFMAVSRTLLRAIAQFSDGPGPCMVRLNDLLAADNDEMMFVTLFYAILDTRDGSLVYANAGHNPPYVMRADGTIEVVPRTNGMALAVMDGIEYAENRLTLARGDGLFMFTDGVTEALDPDLQLFGEVRLVDGLTRMQAMPVREIPAEVVAMIKRFEAGSAQADDITCLMVRYGVDE